LTQLTQTPSLPQNCDHLLFHEGEAAASVRTSKRPDGGQEWGSKGNEADYLSKLCKLLAKMEPDDQKLLFHMAQTSREA
jgi:hypothetical protein